MTSPVFDAGPLGSYLTRLDAVDELRVGVPFHHPCADNTLENEQKRPQLSNTVGGKGYPLRLPWKTKAHSQKHVYESLLPVMEALI